jgi:hypothetical protein
MSVLYDASLGEAILIDNDTLALYYNADKP